MIRKALIFLLTWLVAANIVCAMRDKYRKLLRKQLTAGERSVATCLVTMNVQETAKVMKITPARVHGICKSLNAKCGGSYRSGACMRSVRGMLDIANTARIDLAQGMVSEYCDEWNRLEMGSAKGPSDEGIIKLFHMERVFIETFPEFNLFKYTPSYWGRLLY